MINSNLLRLKVGNEYFKEKTEINEDWTDYIPDIIDYLLTPFDFSNLITGYLYFNLTVETFGYGLWRGSELCFAPNYIMVFPSAYKIGDKIYWGTDVQPNFGSVKNSYIGFFGSKSRDLLGDWGFYDNIYLDFLKDMILNWFNLMNDFPDWYNNLFNSPNNYNIARLMEYGRQTTNLLLDWKPNDIINTAKQFLGDTYDYVKEHPVEAIITGITFLPKRTITGMALATGLSICYHAYKYGYLKKWKNWKETNGDNLTSWAKFMANYLNPLNPDGIVGDLKRETGKEINNMKDLLNAFWEVLTNDILNSNSLGNHFGNLESKSWEDWYNELSTYTYNSIIGEDLEEVAFMVRDCAYGVISYDGWLFPKYHIYKAYDFQTPKYELRKLIFFGDDALIVPVDFDVNYLFNNPITDMLLIKTYDEEYFLLSELLSTKGTYYLCSPYPSYIQMKLFGIPKLRLE